MCVIFFYVNSNPNPGGYKLILASNRDEFYSRPTMKAAKWQTPEENEKLNVYGGMDLEAGREGGTWLAIGVHNKVVKVGALLNLTGEPRPRDAQGRGMIVSNFVSTTQQECSIDKYNKDLLSDCTNYSAFNFVSLEISSPTVPARVLVCSNKPPTLYQYENGKCYGFGNSLPDAPFEKVSYGQNQFEKIVENFLVQEESNSKENAQERRSKLVENLQDLLKCKTKFWPDAELKRRAPNWGEDLSALNVCVKGQNYGSRTHTVILLDAQHNMHFIEQTLSGTDPNGIWETTHLEDNCI